MPALTLSRPAWGARRGSLSASAAGKKANSKAPAPVVRRGSVLEQKLGALQALLAQAMATADGKEAKRSKAIAPNSKEEETETEGETEKSGVREI